MTNFHKTSLNSSLINYCLRTIKKLTVSFKNKVDLRILINSIIIYLS